MDAELHGRDAELALMERELRKLIVGFGALVRYPYNGIKELAPQERKKSHVVVVVPPWGCGTFGGDFKIKLLLIWLAASVVTSPNVDPPLSRSIELRLAVKEAWWDTLDAEWRMFLEAILKVRNVGDVSPGGDIAPSMAPPWSVSMLWNKLRGYGKEIAVLGLTRTPSNHETC